eukprot:m.44217 g.44217  ORF g.44217 m.44217 type:complete len:65 (-) comp8506_c0_seq2:169-363(-)
MVARFVHMWDCFWSDESPRSSSWGLGAGGSTSAPAPPSMDLEIPPSQFKKNPRSFLKSNNHQFE